MPPKAKKTYIENGLVFNKSDDSPVINKTTGLQRAAPKPRIRKAAPRKTKKVPKGMKKLPGSDLDAFALANPSRVSEAKLDAVMAGLEAMSGLKGGFSAPTTARNKRIVNDAITEMGAISTALGGGLQPLPPKIKKARTERQQLALYAAQEARKANLAAKRAAQAPKPPRAKRVATPAQKEALARGRAIRARNLAARR